MINRKEEIARKLSPVSKYSIFPERRYLVNHKYHFIYCPIPKVASSSITQFLASLTTREGHIPHIHNYVCSRFSLGTYDYKYALSILNDETFFKFAFVRNPWTRITSVYLNKFMGTNQELYPFLKKVVDSVYYRNGLEPNYQKSITFRQFIEYLVLTEDQKMNAHWMPQHLLLGKSDFFNFIGRFENLTKDFEYIREKLNIPVKLPGRNQTNYSDGVLENGKKFDHCYPYELRQLPGYPSSEQFYTPELRELVRQKYSKDFELFAY